METVPYLPDDVWHLILGGVDDNGAVLSARCVSREFKDALCDTFDALRFIRNIRLEYKSSRRSSMEHMGLLRFTRAMHKCTEREEHLLAMMLQRCSDTRLTEYTRQDFFVIALTERSVLQNLILPLYTTTI